MSILEGLGWLLIDIGGICFLIIGGYCLYKYRKEVILPIRREQPAHTYLSKRLTSDSFNHKKIRI